MRVVLDAVHGWRHELGNCLHSCVAVVLARHGLDPGAVLGARWGFHYRAGDVRREEYYWPCPPGVSVAEALAPYHPVRSSWHRPADAEQGWRQVRARIVAGEPALVAVDNFWLPFRPAYQDVHSNHLVVVYGFDDEEDLVWVHDRVPPAFDGPLPRTHLDAARDSGNPLVHDRDLFFTANPIRNRWLSVDVGTAPPETDPRAALRRCLGANLRDFTEPAPGDGYAGLPGVADFLDHAADRLAAGEAVAEETFVVAGTAVASAALHASALRSAAVRLRDPVLAETARAVDRMAHHWTAVRILVNTIDATGAVRLRRRARVLVADWRWALTEVERALEAL